MGEINSDFDIPLTKEEKEQKINLIKSMKFEDFEIHNYFYKHSYPKHGVDIEEIKKIFYQFDKIKDVFKRPANKGFKYSFIYQLKDNESFIICFFLDEKKLKFFNAYSDYRNVEKRVKRKYFGFSK